MFDFHLHTTKSDGVLSVEEMLDTLHLSSIQPFSLTDHNHALAYACFDYHNYPCIPGTEIATSYKGEIIELLGFGIDPIVINAWYRKFYSNDNLERIEKILFKRIQECAEKQKYFFDESLPLECFEKGSSKKIMYQELFRNNLEFAKIYPSYKSFFRKGLSNPDSPFFINEADTYLSFDETIDLIHRAGGKAFLAHIFEYDSFRKNGYIEEVKDRLDGIECFHPSIPMRESIKLFKYCEENHLYVSGGSDFHKPERHIPFGVHLDRSLLLSSSFHWIPEYLRKLV